MKHFKQALILCGGKATRLRPYSYSHSKAELPFLNLPTLSYPWKLAEDLKNNSFLLNSHLFPEEFKKTVGELSKKDQKTQVFFEKEPLSSTGTLYHFKKELKKSPYFTYINGDCLLFPSSSQKLFEFEQEFLNSKAEALLFVTPVKYNSKHSSLSQSTSNDKGLFFEFREGFLDSYNKNNSCKNDERGKESSRDKQNNNYNKSQLTKDDNSNSRDKQNNNYNEGSRYEEKRINRKEQKRFLYCDSQQNLKEIRLPQSTDEQAYFFTGLALFKSSLLDKLKETEKDLFSDFLQPLLAHKKIKVFIDKDAFFLEAGDKESYLKSTEFCLKSLLTPSLLCSDHHRLSSLQESPFNQNPGTQEQAFFQEQTKFVRKRLQDTFKRFDPKDEKVGLKNGSIWSQKLKAFLLAPYSVRGLDLLKVEGFSVIAPKVGFYNKTKVKNSVLICPHFSLQGFLKEDLILTKALR